MRKYLLTICALACCTGASAQPATFRNPVIPGDMADPTVIRIDSVYYASGTSSEWAPCYPLFRSTDLVNWQQIGHLFEELPSWTRSSFWAPELFLHNGKVYVYYTARRKSDGTSCIGVATAANPEGPYTDRGPVVEYGSEAIDAFVFEDDGDLYISWKAYGLDARPIELLACRLTPDGLHLDGEPFTLLRDDERRGMEGQQWLRIGSTYYIVYAVNGCCGPGSDYAVAAARSESLRGPYEKDPANPILHGGGPVRSCGHGTLATTPDGRMYYLCHAYMKGADFSLGRQSFLQEIVLSDDGWLRFAGGDTARIEQPVPFPGTVQRPATPFTDDFDAEHLRPEWTWNYPYASPDIEPAGGVLLLGGRPVGDAKNGTALCLRPAAAEYTFETEIADRTEALCGITLYGDDGNLVVWGLQGNRLLLKQFCEGREEALHTPLVVEGDAPVCLRMRVEAGRPVRFGYDTGDGWKEVLPQKAAADPMRWDRAARPGLYYHGPENRSAAFGYARMTDR